jgi:hypothetical protein
LKNYQVLQPSNIQNHSVASLLTLAGHDGGSAGRPDHVCPDRHHVALKETTLRPSVWGRRKLTRNSMKGTPILFAMWKEKGLSLLAPGWRDI